MQRRSKEVEEAIKGVDTIIDNWVEVPPPNSDEARNDYEATAALLLQFRMLSEVAPHELISATRSIASKLPRRSIDVLTSDREVMAIQMKIHELYSSVLNLMNLLLSEGYVDAEAARTSPSEASDVSQLQQIEAILNQTASKVAEFQAETIRVLGTMQKYQSEIHGEVTKPRSGTSVSIGPLSVETERLVEAIDDALDHVAGHTDVAIGSLNRVLGRVQVRSESLRDSAKLVFSGFTSKISSIADSIVVFSRRAVSIGLSLFADALKRMKEDRSRALRRKIARSCQELVDSLVIRLRNWSSPVKISNLRMMEVKGGIRMSIDIDRPNEVGEQVVGAEWNPTFFEELSAEDRRYAQQVLFGLLAERVDPLWSGSISREGTELDR